MFLSFPGPYFIGGSMKRLTLKDWVRILSNALIIAEEKRTGAPLDPCNYGIPFYLIPLKPEEKRKRG